MAEIFDGLISRDNEWYGAFRKKGLTTYIKAYSSVKYLIL